MVVIDALPASPDNHEALDIGRLSADALILLTAGREQLLIRQGLRSIRLDLREGTLLNGPVRLRYAIEGLSDLGHRLLTLRRLLALRRLGRFPTMLFPGEQRAARWILILRVLDALAAGATQKEMAQTLFGGGRVRTDWRTSSDYLRLRVQRLVRAASSLSASGYRSILRGGERI